MSEPPVAKFKFTLTVTGNTLEEIEHEIVMQTRGGFLLDSDGFKRDSWHVWGGRTKRVMEHLNPQMTPERYETELEAWFEERKAEQRATS